MSKKKPSLASTIVRACRRALRVNQFEKTLVKMANEEPEVVYLLWNRGLGDVALGLYGVVRRIRQYDKTVRIVFVTRPDLAEAFALVPDCETWVFDEMKRGDGCTIRDFIPEGFCFPPVDPSKDLSWLPGRLIPHLKLPEEAKKGCEKFQLGDESYVALHVNSETGHFYGYEKNWPRARWQELITSLKDEGKKVLLLGSQEGEPFEGGVDLRGKTTLFDVLALLVQVCDTLVAPDSGILSTIYYVDTASPLHVISLWADPHQGVLRQNVPSPNEYLRHEPLINEEGICHIQTKQVLDSILHDTLIRV